MDISNRCGTVRSEAELTTLPCEDCVWLPNAFSPGGDGKNDLFRAVLRCLVQSFEMKIFNRWGQIIFQTINPNEGWDGNFLGTQQPVGVYYYYIKSQTGVGSEVIENALKGEIHLLR